MVRKIYNTPNYVHLLLFNLFTICVVVSSRHISFPYLPLMYPQYVLQVCNTSTVSELDTRKNCQLLRKLI